MRSTLLRPSWRLFKRGEKAGLGFLLSLLASFTNPGMWDGVQMYSNVEAKCSLRHKPRKSLKVMKREWWWCQSSSYFSAWWSWTICYTRTEWRSICPNSTLYAQSYAICTIYTIVYPYHGFPSGYHERIFHGLFFQPHVGLTVHHDNRTAPSVPYTLPRQ